MTTSDDLLNANDNTSDWLTVHRTYDGQRYSPLEQIDKSNVAGLKVAYTVALGGTEGGGFWRYGNIEATPIVEDGMMYMPNGWSELTAIDLRAAGQGVDMIKWIYDPGVDKDWAGNVACCAINNRGVALWQDKVIMSVLDGRMMALDKDSGEQVWEIQLADPAIAETITVAPLVIGDLAITGVSGAEYGIRGWLAAVDLNTGRSAGGATPSPPRRTRSRDLDRRPRRLADRRRLDLADRLLRPGTQPGLLGHRQPGAGLGS